MSKTGEGGFTILLILFLMLSCMVTVFFAIIMVVDYQKDIEILEEKLAVHGDVLISSSSLGMCEAVTCIASSTLEVNQFIEIW